MKIYTASNDKCFKCIFQNPLKKYMEELKKVNVIPQFREFITEEQDKEFILDTKGKE